MTTRTSASLAALALLAAGAIALRFAPATPAAVGLPGGASEAKPRIERVTVEPVALAEGRISLAAVGENVDRYQIWATCPRAVSLKIGGADICDSRLNRDDDQLKRQIATLENAAAATGTVAITVRVDQPEAPVAPWTQKTVAVRLTAGR